MTWSIDHTITYVNSGSNHDAFVYLFDTVLAGKASWSVGPHPTSAVTKRIASFSCNNRVTGSPYTMHHWVDWYSTSTNTLQWSEDATYSASPGDTANDPTNQITSDTALSVAGEDWRFCSSSDNAESVLVLKGGRLFFYWPGITDGVFWEDASWDGSQDNKGTWVCPHIGDSYGSLRAANSPITTGTSSTSYLLLPDSGFSFAASNGGFRLPGNYIATKFNWLYSSMTTYAYPTDYSHAAFSNGGHSDVGVWLPETITNEPNNREPFGYDSGMTMQIGSDFWFNTWTDLGRQGVIFNFGPNDPLA